MKGGVNCERLSLRREREKGREMKKSREREGERLSEREGGRGKGRESGLWRKTMK